MKKLIFLIIPLMFMGCTERQPVVGQENTLQELIINNPDLKDCKTYYYYIDRKNYGNILKCPNSTTSSSNVITTTEGRVTTSRTLTTVTIDGVEYTPKINKE